jgi:cytochrome c-type biogenesis protein CcmF
LILAIYGGVLALGGSAMPMALKARILAVQGMVTTGFLAFSLFTSNPFLRLANIPLDGKGLNPILQDPGLAIHPPMLYLGYVGLSMAFAFAVAALITGEVDRLWAKWMRPWIMAAWCALTCGIALGSWWAYYELGWGGWWFWDPVENASLMPWLAATALLHSAIVVEKRGQLKSWTVLLAIMAFSLSLVGTFIVRSGLLTSVHSFASDPARGVFVLAILLFAVGIPLALYAWRGPQLVTTADFTLTSREGGLIANNMLLVVATAIVLLGTFYPLGLEMVTGARITVGPPYFDATFQSGHGAFDGLYGNRAGHGMAAGSNSAVAASADLRCGWCRHCCFGGVKLCLWVWHWTFGSVGANRMAWRGHWRRYLAAAKTNWHSRHRRTRKAHPE